MIIDRLLARLAPYECLGCSKEGQLVCAACQEQFVSVLSRCYRCRRPTDNFETCELCRLESAVDDFFTATMYGGMAKELVRQLKFHSAKSAASEMAQSIVKRHLLAANALLIPVPTATMRVRARSYDQATLLSKALSRLTGIPHVSLLRRLGQAHQVGTGRAERFAHLQDAYRLTRPALAAGRHILLVDDVSTTGATLEAAAKVMKAAGAKRVSGLVFAQA